MKLVYRFSYQMEFYHIWHQPIGIYAWSHVPKLFKMYLYCQFLKKIFTTYVTLVKYKFLFIISWQTPVYYHTVTPISRMDWHGFE